MHLLRRLAFVLATAAALVSALLATLAWRIVKSPPAASIDEAASSDALLVFAGGRGDRLEAALEIVEAALAADTPTPVLVLSRGNDEWYKVHSPALLRFCEQGLPKTMGTQTGFGSVEVLCIVPEPDNTIGEALAFASLVEQNGWEVITVVTSDSHLGRAHLWTGRCVASSVEVLAIGSGGQSDRATTFDEWLSVGHGLAIDRRC